MDRVGERVRESKMLSTVPYVQRGREMEGWREG